MGVYIKGMEMPLTCWLCPLSVLYEKPRGMLVCKIAHKEVLRHTIDGNCPLVSVPEHGDLIDRDEFIFDMSECVATIGQLLNAPVIIKAGGEEE